MFARLGGRSITRVFADEVYCAKAISRKHSNLVSISLGRPGRRCLSSDAGAASADDAAAAKPLSPEVEDILERIVKLNLQQVSLWLRVDSAKAPV